MHHQVTRNYSTATNDSTNMM
jgi:hypothetical protein